MYKRQIEHLDELGDLCRKYLIVELMGKHSNIIFCTPDDKIIDSIKHISAQISSCLLYKSIFKFACGYCLTDFTAHSGGLDSGYRSILNKRYNRIIGLTKGAGTDG